MLNRKRYPLLTRLMAATEVEHGKDSQNTAGTYRTSFKVTTDLSHLIPGKPDEDNMSELLDKLIGHDLEQELSKSVWTAVRHEIQWVENVSIESLDLDAPGLREISNAWHFNEQGNPGQEKEMFAQTADKLKECLKKASVDVEVLIHYEMPADEQVKADDAIGKFLKQEIDRLK